MLPPVRLSRGKPVEVEPGRWRLGGKTFSQIALRSADPGKAKLTMKRSRRMKAVIERALHIGGEDGEAPIGLHALQQIVDLDVGVAVVAILDFAALAEQGIGLVEEEDAAAVLGGIEEAAQVLLRSRRYIC